MQDETKKIFRWIIGGGVIAALLVIPEMLISKSISNNNPEVFEAYVTIMILITAFIYLTISVIKVVKYQKYAKNYKQKKIEKVSKELTTEFKKVNLNYSEPISKNLFECQAKVDKNGKIVCKIQLDYEVNFKSYEEFLSFFNLDELY